jgi:hypothetical protein
MTEKPLSKTMVDTLKWIAGNGGVVERQPGGFWVIPHLGRAGSWTGTPTMNALVRRRKVKWTDWQRGKKGTFPIKAEVET